MNKIKELFKKYREVIMYLIFGVATTLVNWVTAYVIQKAFNLSGEGVEFTITNAIAWIVAVLFAFFTNKKYVFESKTVGAKAYFTEMGKFIGARLATGAIEISLPTALVSLGLKQSLNVTVLGKSLNYKSFWAKAVTSVIVIILNYVFSKLFVFRKKKPSEDDVTDNVAAEESDTEAEAAESAAENEAAVTENSDVAEETAAEKTKPADGGEI